MIEEGMAINQQFEEWWVLFGWRHALHNVKSLARAAWNEGAFWESSRLPEEHLAVVLEALRACEKEAQNRAFEISGGNNRAHYRNKADRYAATRRFLEGQDD